MFNRKAQPAIRSLISETTVVSGGVRFREGLRIDGHVNGDIVAEPSARSLVVISEKARVRGKVNAGHVIINGEVVGPVVSTEMLELQPKARVLGDVSYQVLEMHPGATIDGELKPIKAAEPPPLKLAASNNA
ncbi:MAG: polymer-forming cytoskeletal protein [Rubrivivax sp.]|nr:polymer-forming cytoskeletal protein [Rubrivivax sp.]